jgi:putative spermidine/putrescine transport system ATP-binding protein
MGRLMSSAVSFRNVSRRFGSVRAVDGVTLDIKEGEFFAMLGPSGSGKTTCLRLIAGFEQPDEGHIEIFGETAEGVPPYKRNVNTVFQDYALFPHMTVGENVAYGLRIKGVAKEERDAKAREALAMVKLAKYEDRRPSQLSGGQRQRVALARALVNGPKVLLLDEPLGALDLKLRERMQEELKALQKKLGITFVFVTHDQGEALSMANRVAIFNDGKIVQVGLPTDVYERPQSRFVADFVGSSNVLSPEFASQQGGPAKWTSLRPEKVGVYARGTAVPAQNAHADGEVKMISYQGSVTRFSVEIENARITAEVPAGGPDFEQGDNVDHLRKFIVRNPDLDPDVSLKIWKFIEEIGTSGMSAWYKIAGVHGGGSRLVPHAQYYDSEKLGNFLDCFRQALAHRGFPEKLHTDRDYDRPDKSAWPGSN